MVDKGWNSSIYSVGSFIHIYTYIILEYNFYFVLKKKSSQKILNKKLLLIKNNNNNNNFTLEPITIHYQKFIVKVL